VIARDDRRQPPARRSWHYSWVEGVRQADNGAFWRDQPSDGLTPARLGGLLERPYTHVFATADLFAGEVLTVEPGRVRFAAQARCRRTKCGDFVKISTRSLSDSE
jgi:hypothetical protein